MPDFVWVHIPEQDGLLQVLIQPPFPQLSVDLVDNMPLNGTLIELLTAVNPVLDLRRQPGAVRQVPSYEPLDEDDVLDWPDLSFENLKAAYGHLFDIGPLALDAVQDMRGTSFDNVVKIWNYRTCSQPIKRATEKVQVDLGAERCGIDMEYLSQNNCPRAAAKSNAPDWCISLRELQDSEDDENRIIAVCGDTKCSSWCSSNRMTTRSRADWIFPLRRVLTCCVNNKTRYGYILTSEEVVVFRVYEDRSTPPSPWRIQHAAIPWENAGESTLTVNLAIWALAMMSLNEGHRPIRSLDQTLPLNVWWEHDGASPAYEHHLSGRKVSETLERADVRARPVSTYEDDTRRRRSRRLQK